MSSLGMQKNDMENYLFYARTLILLPNCNDLAMQKEERVFTKQSFCSY